jgi:hypothetical protein
MEEAPAFFLAALDGDAETVSKMLSTAGAQSLINYQHALGDTPLLTALGATPLLAAAANGHVAVTEQLLQAPCNVDLQMQGGVSRSFLDRYFELASLIEARCSIDVPNVHGMTALHAAERMGHTAIPTLIRNTRQKIAESIVRQAEEERLGLVALLAAVPQEDWCRTWPACRTIMFRRTSKIVKEQVDKMRLPAVVCLCELWRDGINRSPVGGGRPNKMENVQIVINQLPLMTAWCRITTLKLHVLYPSDFRGDRSPETFAGVLEGVLGQSTGSLTDLDLDSNCLGSDGVRRLAGVLSQCTLLRYLVLAANDVDDDGADIVTRVLPQCPALKTLDLQINDIGCHGAGSLVRVLVVCTALTSLNLAYNDIRESGAEIIAKVLGECPKLKLKHLDLRDNNIGTVANRRLSACCTRKLDVFVDDFDSEEEDDDAEEDGDEEEEEDAAEEDDEEDDEEDEDWPGSSDAGWI